MKNRHFCNFYFFYFTSIGVIVPYWGLYLQYLEFSATQIGELMAILLFTKVITPNLWALLADKVASKNGNSLSILTFATGFTLISFSAMLLVNQYWSVALVMFCYCIFWNACLPQVEAATLNHLNDDRYRYGNIRLWGSLGFIFTVLLVGILLDSFGPPIILHASIVCMLSMFLASIVLSKRAKQQQSELIKQQLHTKQQDHIPLKKLLNKRIIIILALCFFMQLSHAPFYSFYSIFLESYGYSKFHIGGLWSFGVIFEILIFLTGHHILKRFKLLSLLSFTFFIAALRWCLVANYPEATAIMWLGQTLHALTYGLYHIVMIQIIDQYFKGHYQIRGQALYSSITFGLGGAIGSVVSGYIWTYYGQTELFNIAGGLMFCVMLTSFIFIREHESN